MSLVVAASDPLQPLTTPDYRPVTSAAVRSVTSRTELEIVTAEGDRVTLSATLTRSVAAVRSETDQGSTTALATSSSRALSIAVDGELSRDELEDIAKVLRLLRRASHHRAARDPERLARRLAHAHLDALDRVSASFTTSRTVGAAVLPAPPDPVTAQRLE